METLQATPTTKPTVMPYQILEDTGARVPFFMILNHEGDTIAKVNGKGCLEQCENLVAQANQVPILKALLLNRLIDILRCVHGQGQLQRMCREFVNSRFDELFTMLKDNAQDNPISLVNALGGEAVQIINAL